jgi:carbamoyl-phosphate synthase large subunit
MNILLSCIGRRGYIADFFRPHLNEGALIIGTGNEEHTTGFSHCDLSFVVPKIYDADYIPAILELCKAYDVDALIPLLDTDIDVISKHIDKFKRAGTVPIISNQNISNICFDKYFTSLFFEQEGFNTPKTYIDLEVAMNDIKTSKLNFPLIVKPRHGSASVNIFQAHSLKELNIFFHYKPNMLIQELITGQEYGIDICNDLKGNVMCVVPRTNILRSFGETMHAETSDHPALIEAGVLLGEKLAHTGPLDVDCFLKDGKVFFIELNPRFGGVYPLSHLAGADFPGLIVNMIKGKKIKPQIGKFKAGVVMMKEYNIIQWENCKGLSQQQVATDILMA